MLLFIIHAHSIIESFTADKDEFRFAEARTIKESEFPRPDKDTKVPTFTPIPGNGGDLQAIRSGAWVVCTFLIVIDMVAIIYYLYNLLKKQSSTGSSFSGVNLLNVSVP